MIRASLAALLCLSLGGCATAPPKISLAPPVTQPQARYYFDALKAFTRHGHILSDFDETLTVDATLLAPKMVAALAAKRTQVYRFTPAQAAVDRATLVAETAAGLVLHVETSAHNYDLNDLASTKTVWKLSLLDDQGHAIDHPKITLERQRREVDLAFYPYTNLFGRAWTIHFPLTYPNGAPFLTPSTRALILRIAGPVGTVDLTWNLE